MEVTNKDKHFKLYLCEINFLMQADIRTGKAYLNSLVLGVIFHYRCHGIEIDGKGNSDCTSVYDGVPYCYVIGKTFIMFFKCFILSNLHVFVQCFLST